MKPLTPTWRWFGPTDPIPLDYIRQTGAVGIVTALHEVAPGVAWSDSDISARQAAIEQAGLSWEVVESIPVSDDIKTAGANFEAHVTAWCETLTALGRAGIKTVCYNFMPVIDWTRTQLHWEYPNGSRALRFDIVDCALWDIHVLGRVDARESYDASVIQAAESRFKTLPDDEINRIESAIISGLPGSDRGYTIGEFRQKLTANNGIGADRLRTNLRAFIARVGPVATEAGINLAIHPDDPPFPLFGLPRIVSRHEDYVHLLDAYPEPANGITLCAGSLGSRQDNDVCTLARAFADRIHFAHLRNVTVEPNGSFHEAAHLEGRVPMAELMSILMDENARRAHTIPFRPDHGHAIGPDLVGRFNPGYTFVGRLRGLAELHGITEALMTASKADTTAQAAE